MSLFDTVIFAPLARLLTPIPDGLTRPQYRTLRLLSKGWRVVMNPDGWYPELRHPLCRWRKRVSQRRLNELELLGLYAKCVGLRGESTGGITQRGRIVVLTHLRKIGGLES